MKLIRDIKYIKGLQRYHGYQGISELLSKSRDINIFMYEGHQDYQGFQEYQGYQEISGISSISRISGISMISQSREYFSLCIDASISTLYLLLNNNCQITLKMNEIAFANVLKREK